MIIRNIFRGNQSVMAVLGCSRRPHTHSSSLSRLQARQSHWWCRRTAQVSASLNTRCAEDGNNLLYIPSCSASWNVTLILRNRSYGNSDDVAKAVDDELGHVISEDCALEEGEFFDSPYHLNRKINFKDVGKKVNVGESVIQELNNLFQINRIDALHMVHSKKFLLVSDAAILKTLYFLKDKNISSEQLQRVTWIMLHHVDDLQEKLTKLLEPHLFHTYSEALGFCQFTLKMISRYQDHFKSEVEDFPHHPNRVYYLAERLKVPVEQITEKILKAKQILTMEIKRIKHLLNVFNAYGVQPEDIVCDIRVLCHNAKMAEERLRVAVQAGCTRPKPWICYAADHIFDRFCERLLSQKEVLAGHKDMASYLTHRLECDRHMVDTYFKCIQNQEDLNFSILKKKIDLLFSEGFTPQDVSRSCMYVLHRSERTLATRIKELKEIGYFPFPLVVLCKSKYVYMRAVDRYKDEHCFKNNVDI
ncbi:transcription termination factor, mitochondrial isoform X1 [Cherax quadricarinatus]|uniref:transcription termination factor, mitochondrial isoform X1 n=1 Tax=Cherax quadricarinatus TaxID=27406 RepID=UPI00387E6A29